MDALMLANGVGGMDIALTANRVVAGTFFAISGYHKLFNPKRHAAVLATLSADHVPALWFNQWWVPSVEFCGGLAVLLGFMAPLAALGLIAICAVATCVDGIKRIPSWAPLDKADWLDDLLYLPELLYVVMLLAVLAAGAGPYSIDAVLFN